MSVTVLHAGSVLLQDRGRHGWRQLGVSVSGAWDLGTHDLANRLVGNAADAATMEITLGALTLRFDQAATYALTGAPAGDDMNTAISVPAGTEIALHRPISGLRSYLAIRGGFSVPMVLGSRSSDSLSGLGPATLRTGEVIPVGTQISGGITGAHATTPAIPRLFRVMAGPRDDWFTDEALTTLSQTEWTVRPESNRVGVRLSGQALQRRVTRELPSEPMIPGALQVPPDGRPIILGPDAPVTGGYPVIAVLTRADFAATAQLRPGDTLRFALTDVAPSRHHTISHSHRYGRGSRDD